MTVIFFDIKRETYLRVENVNQICSNTTRINGRMCGVWELHKNDYTVEDFKKSIFQFERIES